jgi:hypothetical protein
MTTKKEELREGSNGCFARALDDEPMFVLLARDDRAPERVREWATQRKADISMGRRPESDMAQVDEAYQTATDMEDWREENDGKWRNGLFAGVDKRP